MSRLSFGLARSEHIEQRAALINSVEYARRELIKRELIAERNAKRARHTALAYAACAAVAGIVAAFLI